MKYTTLDNRLLCVASLVPKGARMADVGSDHAYLPVYLVQQGIVTEALATDVNEGPIQRAKMNIQKAGLSAQIDARKCDGLDGIESFAPDTVTICGMGGELIVSILENSAYVLKNAPLLILQPMTQAAVLRRYLAEKGYAIEAERLLPDEHRVYQVIACRYVGAPASSLSPLWELVGQGNKESPHLPLLLAKIKKQYSDIVKGKQSAGQDTAWEEALLKEVEEYETR